MKRLINNLKLAKLITIACLVSGSQMAIAQQTAEKFVMETKYLLGLPEGYAADTTTRWPLLIFLHGSGESGTELDKVKIHGPPKLIEKGKKYPFIVVSPQAPPNTGWRTEVLKSMLDDLKTKYRVDNDRVYLTGLSMGGFGTWELSEKFPDDFAAIAPVCGGGDESRVYRLRHIPVWCFHGAKDDVVLPAESIKMVDALRKINSNVKFTLYPEANHNSWDLTYDNDSLYTWLLAQKKFRYTKIALSQTQLKEYEGTYMRGNSGDSLKMIVQDGKLMIKTGQELLEIKPSSETNFFWNDNSTDELQFTRDKKRKCTGFVLVSNEKTEFRKLEAGIASGNKSAK